MQRLERTIAIDAATAVSSVWLVPEDYRPGEGSAVVLAHGAGTDMHAPFLSALHESLAEHGLLAMKFNFPYREQGRRAPDRAPRLEAAWHAVLEALHRDSLSPRRVFIGGRSMGGRIASHLAAADAAVDGLVLLGYPLHPAGRPERERSAHLPAVTCPILFVQGSRDRLCSLARLREIIAPLEPRARLHVIEEGDHGFAVPKRSGRSGREVSAEIESVVADWIKGRK
jgi:predicted alpha/beta-hydrolase family hydrolase